MLNLGRIARRLYRNPRPSGPSTPQLSLISASKPSHILSALSLLKDSEITVPIGPITPLLKVLSACVNQPESSKLPPLLCSKPFLAFYRSLLESVARRGSYRDCIEAFWLVSVVVKNAKIVGVDVGEGADIEEIKGKLVGNAMAGLLDLPALHRVIDAYCNIRIYSEEIEGLLSVLGGQLEQLERDLNASSPRGPSPPRTHEGAERNESDKDGPRPRRPEPEPSPSVVYWSQPRLDGPAPRDLSRQSQFDSLSIHSFPSIFKLLQTLNRTKHLPSCPRALNSLSRLVLSGKVPMDPVLPCYLPLLGLSLFLPHEASPLLRLVEKKLIASDASTPLLGTVALASLLDCHPKTVDPGVVEALFANCFLPLVKMTKSPSHAARQRTIPTNIPAIILGFLYASLTGALPSHLSSSLLDYLELSIAHQPNASAPQPLNLSDPDIRLLHRNFLRMLSLPPSTLPTPMLNRLQTLLRPYNLPASGPAPTGQPRDLLSLLVPDTGVPLQVLPFIRSLSCLPLHHLNSEGLGQLLTHSLEVPIFRDAIIGEHTGVIIADLVRAAMEKRGGEALRRPFSGSLLSMALRALSPEHRTNWGIIGLVKGEAERFLEPELVGVARLLAIRLVRVNYPAWLVLEGLRGGAEPLRGSPVPLQCFLLYFGEEVRGLEASIAAKFSAIPAKDPLQLSNPFLSAIGAETLCADLINGAIDDTAKAACLLTMAFRASVLGEAEGFGGIVRKALPLLSGSSLKWFLEGIEANDFDHETLSAIGEALKTFPVRTPEPLDLCRVLRISSRFGWTPQRGEVPTPRSDFEAFKLYTAEFVCGSRAGPTGWSVPDWPELGLLEAIRCLASSFGDSEPEAGLFPGILLSRDFAGNPDRYSRLIKPIDVPALLSLTAAPRPLGAGPYALLAKVLLAAAEPHLSPQELSLLESRLPRCPAAAPPNLRIVASAFSLVGIDFAMVSYKGIDMLSCPQRRILAFPAAEDLLTSPLVRSLLSSVTRAAFPGLQLFVMPINGEFGSLYTAKTWLEKARKIGAKPRPAETLMDFARHR